MTTDTTEKGLESLIMRHMTGTEGLTFVPGVVREHPAPYGGTGYLPGDAHDFDRTNALDVTQLFEFLIATQPVTFKMLGMADTWDRKDINRLKFLTRLSAEIGKRGVIDVLRKGVEHGPVHLDLFYGTPSPGNATAEALHAKNRFSVTRQLRYSLDETRRALDLCLFINGLPIATFELKNGLTKQSVEDAILQYKRDRSPAERLFEFGRCAVHFAVDDREVWMCAELKGKDSWFLPFNKGYKKGAGNPPAEGIKTAYLWQEILTPEGLTDILENYAQIITEPDPRTGKKKRKQVWPRYHQLRVVRRVLADVRDRGPGKRYLIQHSAGSGKSNSIAWLAHQLIGVKRGGKEVFDSVIVVTDRRLLDQQIQLTIKQFMQVGATVGHAHHSGDLRTFIDQGKKIIVSTVQKFPHILEAIATEDSKTFAIVIDEAHSSQGGKSSAAMSEKLGGPTGGDDEEADPEDTINAALEKRMSSRKLLTHASYFAFTATPKEKTLQMFGEPLPADAEGKVKHEPFDGYSMKQAIEERFILDVLKNYTPVESYYKLIKRTEDDPEFDTKKAKKKLRRYVEGHEHAIRLKAEIMVDHFHEQVIAVGKIGGQARAMVVTSGIERAIQYFHAFKAYLAERKSPYRAIVAFSGEWSDDKLTEWSLNGFSSGDIAAKIQTDPYRFLICADKFQTGYDEPLLHTMYVDKALSGIKAVQTLSRLNRAHPGKLDCFVLDFQNNGVSITEAFQAYYQTTLLADETDPNRLHDLKAALDAAQVYSPEQVQRFVELFLNDADRDHLDPILHACVAAYEEQLDEDGQVEFKGKAKVFCRTYAFLSSVLPYNNREWEKLSILLNLLIPWLPTPKEEDLAQGILETIDMDSYRVEKKAVQAIALAPEDAEIEPVSTEAGHRRPEPEIDRLSNILKTFNEQFGTLFTDTDRVAQRIRDDIAPKVAADTAYQNAKENTPHTARMAHDHALAKVMQHLLKDDTQVYKQFVENEGFKRFVGDMVYAITNG